MMRRIHGFTLIETLLALMVFAFVLVGFMTVLGQTNRIQGDLAEHRVAMILAQNLLEEIRMAPTFEAGERTGTFPGRYDRFTWTSDIVEHEEIEYFFDVTVTVSWGSQGSSGGYELQTMMTKLPETALEEPA